MDVAVLLFVFSLSHILFIAFLFYCRYLFTCRRCIFLAKYPLQQFLNDRGGYFRNIYFFCFQDNLSRIFKFTILETFLFVFVHDRRKFMRRLQSYNPTIRVGLSAAIQLYSSLELRGAAPGSIL
jgi:hypothetical protein